MIKFEKNGENFSFYSENIKVIFSEPTIQAHDEYGACKEEKDILYYYYGVEVLSKKHSNRWKQIFSLGTYDFPEILNFKLMLEVLLNGKLNIEEYQKADCGEGHVWYTYHLDSSPLCEDFYTVTHSILKEDGDVHHETYTISVGKALDFSCSEVQSVSLGNLSKTDIQTIYQCVEEFVDYSIEKTHNINVERNKTGLESFKIKDGKLYEMNKDGTEVVAVYVPGDKIEEVKILHGDINSKDFKSTSICRFTIDAITKDSIIISSGYEDIRRDFRRINEPEEIKLNVILDVFDYVSEEKLKYNEEEIAEDFILVLSEKEKEEFKIRSEDLLFKRWNQAILNRTWMCRDEHNLPKRVENNGQHENVYASIKEIIKIIKTKLN